MYLDKIRTDPVSFPTHAPGDPLGHLYLTYNQVISLDIKENDISMRKSYNPTNSIEILYKQIDDGIFEAALSSPYSIQ